MQPGTAPVSLFLMTNAKVRWVLAVLQSRRSGEVMVDVFLAPERAAEKILARPWADEKEGRQIEAQTLLCEGLAFGNHKVVEYVGR